MAQQKQRLSSFLDGVDDSFFPLENLPFGVFQPKNSAKPRIGTAVGQYVLDLAELEKANLFDAAETSAFDHDALNHFAAKGENFYNFIRNRLQQLLSKDHSELQKNTALLDKALHHQADVVMHMPFKTESFSDFYASEQHASNVGKLFRSKENPLLPNWKYLPVGYHGRASTLFLSGKDIKRPMGQIKYPDKDSPCFSASEKLDFELELGFFVGVGNPCGTPISIRQAKSHIFGVTLLNDWSARDIQAFEYQPLGPFLAKSFATSISPWVVSYIALQNFMHAKPKQEPSVVSYLQQEELLQPKIKLKVELQPQGSTKRTTICETNSTELYWTMEQILAHHTINNCIMKTGDLIGTGTISGQTQNSWGSLLEITFNGSEPLKLHDGSDRKFLQDGDTVIFTGYCETDDFKIGFGTLESKILPAT